MRTRSFTEILSRMIDLTLINSGEINDFSRSSVIYTIYQSIALELEMLGMLNRENVLEGIRTGIYEAFEFPRKEARKAYGEVTINFTSKLARDRVIPQGTEFYSTIEGYNQRFEMIEPQVAKKGLSSVIVKVYATQPGSQGNIPENTLNATRSNLYDIVGVGNSEAFLTGRDKESLEDVKRRFRGYVESRGRATNQAIDYAARKVEDITGVYIAEEVGRIKLYAHDGSGNLSKELREEVIKMVENYRPSGIKLDVYPIKKRVLNIEAVMTLQEGVEASEGLIRQVESRIGNHINSKDTSEGFVLMELSSEIMGIDPNLIYDFRISNIDENIYIGPEELLRAGEITVTPRTRGEEIDVEENTE